MCRNVNTQNRIAILLNLIEEPIINIYDLQGLLVLYLNHTTHNERER